MFTYTVLKKIPVDNTGYGYTPINQAQSAIHSMTVESHAVNLCILKPSVETTHGVITLRTCTLVF